MKLRIEIDLEAVDRDCVLDHQFVGWVGNALQSYVAGIKALNHIPKARVPLHGLRGKVVGYAEVCDETQDTGRPKG